MVKGEESTRPETSVFESSEMLSSLLSSTPLIEEAWKLCSDANISSPPQNFVVKEIGDVSYVAFSCGQGFELMESSFSTMVALECAPNGIFPSLRADDKTKELVMVHNGFFNQFLSLYNNPIFQNQMEGIVNRSKCIVFSGHSVGGPIASLSTLWLLSRLQIISSSLPVLCITFGSPTLGNESFSRAILEERWAGNFLHLVAQYDILPTLLFAPLLPFTQQLHHLFRFWHFSMMSSCIPKLATYISEEKNNQVFYIVLASLEALSAVKEQKGSRFWPFGSYMFCTSNGAICLDHPLAILKMLFVMLAKGSPRSSVEDHVNYEKYIGVLHCQFLERSCFTGGNLAESNYDAGVTLALESSGIYSHVHKLPVMLLRCSVNEKKQGDLLIIHHFLVVQESLSRPAKETLEMGKQGRKRNLNNAKLTVELYNTKTLRVQIEWYKSFCDESDLQMGYYDAFKVRGASRRETKVNLNLLKLASFWKNVINMWETNQLPYDFHKQPRWINASQFYKLLVEPLEIAEYYRNGMHQKKGHYLDNGRDRRYKTFDKWWSEREADNGRSNTRKEYASLTQDSCFWARVEEARDWLNQVRRENDTGRQLVLLDKINKFEHYAIHLIEMKEVSKDVLTKNSSYTLLIKDWRELKPQLQLFRLQFAGFLETD